MDKETDKNIKEPGSSPFGQNRYGDGSSGENHYGDGARNGSDDSSTNPSGEDHLTWVTPPVLLADAERPQPNAAGGI